jgi:CPA2 family monovalent cation:H+ antiporter-2
MAWFTAFLDLSLALGAFLAGLLVAETEYSHQVIADIAPFRDLFASIFFISIGMLVDLPFAVARLPLLVGLAVLMVVGKALATTAALKLAGFTYRIALVCGLGLSQIGEFSFVLMEVGRANGLLLGGRFQILLVAAVFTVSLTPLLVRLGPTLGRRAAAMDRLPEPVPEASQQEPMSGHVVVVGYGMNGSLLARILGETRIPHLVVELNPDATRRARAEGVPVLFGDATREEILDRAGVGRAKMVVLAISDFNAVVLSVRVARSIAPGVEILVRTPKFVELEELRRAGADQVVAEEFESAIEIFTRVLAAYHVPRNVIRAETRALRGEAYKMLRSAPLGPASEAVLEALEAGTTDIYRVSGESRASSRTLRDLDLRRRTGTSVIAVVRGEQSYPNPSSDLLLEPGDCLVLVGSHAEIDGAFRYLDGEAAS